MLHKVERKPKKSPLIIFEQSARDDGFEFETTYLSFRIWKKFDDKIITYRFYDRKTKSDGFASYPVKRTSIDQLQKLLDNIHAKRVRYIYKKSSGVQELLMPELPKFKDVAAIKRVLPGKSSKWKIIYAGNILADDITYDQLPYVIYAVFSSD